MDSRKLLEAFSPAETAEVAAALPDAVFQTEAANRGLNSPATFFGETALHGVLSTESRDEGSQFQTKVLELMSPDAELTAGGQLTTMYKFWHKLGMAPPGLTAVQLEHMQGVLDRYPGRRLLAVPLLDQDGRSGGNERSKLVRRATAVFNFPYDSKHPFMVHGDPRDDYHMGALFSPTGTAAWKDYNSSTRYKWYEDTLCYSDVHGKMSSSQNAKAVTRTALIERLTASGRALMGADGNAWIFPVVNVDHGGSVVADYGGPVKLYNDHTEAAMLAPETTLTILLLEQVAGAPSEQGGFEVTNEATHTIQRDYEFDKGRMTLERAVTCIGRYAAGGYNGGKLGMWGMSRMNDAPNILYRREAASAL